jgi:hydroxyacylglutathione hydrolase
MKPDIKTFIFNPFQVNTYLLSVESSECVIIDPACYGIEETSILDRYIVERNLKPLCILNTHAHVDHLPGIGFFRDKYNIPFFMHRSDAFLLKQAVNQGMLFGFEISQPADPDRYVEDGEVLSWGSLSLEIIHVPGHSPGSIVIKNDEAHILITGDVLFNGSIGRTDLPGGNYESLIHGIKEKLLVLEDSFLVFPGHGPSSTIGQEKRLNPFLQ